LVDIFSQINTELCREAAGSHLQLFEKKLRNQGNVTSIGRKGLKLKREQYMHSLTSKEFWKFKSFWC
jgi:hypothetical protein